MEIVNYSQQAAGTSTVAIFSVYLPALQLTIHKFRLIRVKSGKLIIGYPSYRTDQTTPMGKAVYSSYLEFSKEKGLEFETKVMQALEPFLRG